MRFNPVVCNIAVTKKLAKSILKRLNRQGISWAVLKNQGRVEIAPGYIFTTSARTGRTSFIVETDEGGKLDLTKVPAELRIIVMGERPEMERAVPPTTEEIEAVHVARVRKLLMQAA